MQSACVVLYSHLQSAPLYHIFPHPIKGTILGGKKLLNIKCVFCFYGKTIEMHLFLTFVLFSSSTLHISDGLSVHHQESKTTYSFRYMSDRFC